MQEPVISPWRATLFIIALATCFRLALAGQTGLGIDESYMVAASDRFAAGYFDHPPAAWWLELGSRRLFGGMAPMVVRLPFVALAAGSSLLLHALTERLFGARAGFWAVVAFSISPVFSLAFGSWVLPDGPLDFSLLGAAYALSRAAGIGGRQEAGDARWWLVAGGGAGMALLAKYSAGLVLAGALGFLLSDPVARRQLRGVRPWAAGLLAVCLFLPVIFWNAAHGWQSFRFQASRASAGGAGLRLHPFAPLRIWGGEALFLLPWLWLPLILLLLGALRAGPAERRRWFCAMLGLPPVSFFALTGLWSSTRILYHWAAPGYLLLLPLLGDWAARQRGAGAFRLGIVARFTAFLLAAATLLAIAVLGHGAFPAVGHLFPPGKSPLLQGIDWDSLAPELLARETPDGPPLALATLRWYDAGKIGYALRDRIKVTVFGPEPHQFGISTPASSLLGQDILIMAMPGDISAIADRYRADFKAILPAPALTVTERGATLLVIPVLLGKDLLRAP